MPHSAKILASLLEKACRSFDIQNLVVSPGSRNAPLIIEFTDKTFYNTFSIVDERSAAFFALGIAQQIQKPVVVFCTSGSALLNYYPAVAEAFYSNIPLIIVSADRPKEKIDIADGQTIRQENVFANHSLFNANLVDDDNLLKENASLIDKAMSIAMLQKGPVHINIPFEEPLYETTTLESLDLPTFNFTVNDVLSDIDINDNFVRDWRKASAKMILVGVHQPDEDLNNVLAEISQDPSVIVLTESMSNLHHKDFVNTIDNLIFSLDDAQLETFKPDLLLTFGGMVVSKRVKQFLRKHSPQKHYHISKYSAPDTYFCLTAQIKSEPLAVFKSLQECPKNVKHSYKNIWEKRKEEVEKEHLQFMQTVPFSDLSVFKIIIKNLPQKGMLQLANSSVVRYVQLFKFKQLEVYCNRGTSGIDGCTSTAIGAAVGSKKQTTFVTGDLSFFYDSNALWNNYIPNNFRIILINNGGGGIFRILPGPQTTDALDYFEAPHNFTAKHLCEMYHFDYTQVADEDNLKEALITFYDTSMQPKLLEITTPRDLNDKVLKDYFKVLN